ncbi:MAG: cation transporter [Micavibrio sp.]|nr:cation transporter [Micavibrio sp.]
MSGHHHGHDCNHDHGHDHGHSHGGHAGHSHGPATYDRAFAIGIALNLGFVIVEALAGIFSHSLSLLADAGHNFSDVFSLVLAWGAIWLTRRRPSKNRTYGMGRSSILASLTNAVVLLIAIVMIAGSALGRLMHPQEVETGTMIWVALIGIAINAGTAVMFMRGGKDDINIRGAYLHMAADALISAGVVAAGVTMSVTQWMWIDPVSSLVICAVIAAGTWGLLRDSTDLAMDAVPRNIDRQAVENYLSGLPGVSAVHDLHIWPLSTTSIALTAHLVKADAIVDDEWLFGVIGELKTRFKIGHATLQLENGRGSHECKLASEEVI